MLDLKMLDEKRWRLHTPLLQVLGTILELDPHAKTVEVFVFQCCSKSHLSTQQWRNDPQFDQRLKGALWGIGTMESQVLQGFHGKSLGYMNGLYF